MIKGREFDVVAFCGAYAGGAALLGGGTAAAVAIKDRNVASAKMIEQTGAVSAPLPTGPRVPVDDPETRHSLRYLALPSDRMSYNRVQTGVTRLPR